MEKAWGNVPIRTLPIPLWLGRRFVADNAGTADGAWLVGVDQPDAFPATHEASYAVLYCVRKREIRRMAELDSPASQMLWASADDRWVVWSEASDMPSFFDWRIFAYDLRTGSVRFSPTSCAPDPSARSRGRYAPTGTP
jgi:hypothetical protein